MLTLLRCTQVNMVNKFYSKCSCYHLNTAKKKDFDIQGEKDPSFMASLKKLKLNLSPLDMNWN